MPKLLSPKIDNNIRQGLILHWPTLEGGGSPMDTTRNLMAVKAASDETWSVGQNGSVLTATTAGAFNVANSQVTGLIPTGAGAAFTVAFWHKFSNSDTDIFGFNDGGTADEFLFKNLFGLFYFRITSGFGNFDLSTSVLAAWKANEVHVVGRYNNRVMDAYVNGIQVLTGTADRDNAASSVALAMTPQGSSTLRNLAIWKRQISFSEVQQLYLNPKAPGIVQTPRRFFSIGASTPQVLLLLNAKPNVLVRM